MVLVPRVWVGPCGKQRWNGTWIIIPLSPVLLGYVKGRFAIVSTRMKISSGIKQDFDYSRSTTTRCQVQRSSTPLGPRMKVSSGIKQGFDHGRVGGSMKRRKVARPMPSV